MKQRKQYTKESKQGAVRLVTEQGRSISDAATSLFIPACSLSRWVRAAKEDGKEPFRGAGENGKFGSRRNGSDSGRSVRRFNQRHRDAGRGWLYPDR